MEELERQGKKIPEDVAVTGYDNSLYARQGQGITTITHPQEKLGEMAAKLLLEKLSGVPDEESTVERLNPAGTDRAGQQCESRGMSTDT